MRQWSLGPHSSGSFSACACTDPAMFIVRGKRSVTPDTALRLAQVTGMGADFWLGLQQDWDLWHALTAERAAAIASLEPLPHPG